MNQNQRVADSLRQAVADLGLLKLNEAARWASTQLRGMARPATGSGDAFQRQTRPSSLGSTLVRELSEAPIDESDTYFYAAASFDAREYSTAVHALEPYAGASSPSTFLYFYSRYLKLQKLKVNKQRSATKANALVVESELAELRGDLERVDKDAFLLYVLGMTLMDQCNLVEARRVLVESVHRYPCNWSAWKALAASCPDISSFREVEPTLPEHFMTDFFRSHVLVDMQYADEGLSVIVSSLTPDFPESPAVVCTQAVAYSHKRNYDLSHEMFRKLLTINPHIVESMDVYSNILYVKEDHVELTLLARRLADEDPYRSETCCVIGNFYSFRGAHERAIVYFQRALKLNPNCLAAWTLMVRVRMTRSPPLPLGCTHPAATPSRQGHEMIELKNPPAAIEAYRRAVSLNPSDFRAWYGLGQTYELVNMPYYALHNFAVACRLRPDDSRMWNAMGHCYSSPAVGKLESAIRCYKRALPHDKERVSLRQLAHHHSLLAQSEKDAGHYQEAAKYYKMILEESEQQGAGSREDAAQALAFLAEYHKNTGDLTLSQDMYSKLLDYGAPQHREIAKLSLKEIQDLQMQDLQSPMMQSPAGDASTPGSARPR